MSRSSPVRNGQPGPSPERHAFANYLSDDRNNETSHRDALSAAQAEHERVRAAAIRVYRLHELQERHKEIKDQERIEMERLKAEALAVAEEKRLRELRAMSVPKLPPEPTPAPPQPQPEKPAPAPEPVKTLPKETAPAETQSPAQTAKPTQPQPSAAPLPKPQQPQSQSPFSQQPQTNGTLAPAAPAKPVGLQQQPTAPTAAPISQQPATAVTSNRQAALIQRYSQIHKELKSLRKNLQALAKTAGPPLKTQMGVFRREIRVSIGQLTSGKGANATPTSKITSALKEALSGRVPSPPIDVAQFVVEPRQPVQGADNNEQTLPSLFIYLINICAKGIVNQYINECGANPKAADPIGIFAAHLFSAKEFQWRGQSLIDILMAKFRVACPVLFGLRGNDKMEKGRLILGWKKDEIGWESEQAYNDRMTGLGAGYASIALRDFSKVVKANPYPPANYWKALAGLVNTPEAQVSNAHFVVLRAMIEGYEQRFLSFYGNAGLAALRLALIEFPKKAPKDASAAGSLAALAEVLRSESGLVF